MPLGTQKPLLGTPIDFTHELSKGLVAGWLMNEGSGGVVTDLIGNKNIGTFQNSPTWVAGANSYSIDFDNATSDHITTPFFPDSTHRTLIVKWLMTNDVGDYMLMGCHDAANHRFYTGVSITQNRFIVGIGNTFYTHGSFAYGVNEWHTQAFSNNGANCVVYSDGVYLDDFNYTFSNASSQAFWIGAINWSDGLRYPMPALIEYVYIYDRQLTPEEMQSIYNEPYQMFVQDRNWLWGTIAAPPADPFPAGYKRPLRTYIRM